MNKPKLERCPFCNGVAHYSVTIFGSHIVACGRCHAQSVPCASDELAAKFWNKRPKNRRTPLSDNKALTVECCGTCGHCDPGDGAPYCDNRCSAHYADCVAETDGCMWYKRRLPEKED